MMIGQVTGAEVRVGGAGEVVDGMLPVVIRGPTRKGVDDAVLMLYNNAIEFGSLHGLPLSLPARDDEGFLGTSLQPL